MKASKTLINRLLKENKQKEVEDIFKRVPNYLDAKRYPIFVYIAKGAACNSPIINFSNGEYSYDSYGASFKNWREWDSNGGYGACGSYGKTLSLKCVANSCISYNREHGRVALITESVYNKLKEENYTIEVLKFGFQ